MAAKPAKPPGNFLKSLLNQHNNKKNQQQLQHQNNNEDEDLESNSINGEHLITSSDCNTPIEVAATTKKTNCNCSNISIMHLFHEMKQEFPTIPDTIVAQCVNENCHQRENCIQMLRNELELNPIPAQSYPAKVLHPPNANNINNIQHNSTNNNTQKPPLQQKPVVVQQKPPLKPIKPIRTAPLQPPTVVQQQQQQINNNSNNNNNSGRLNLKNTTTTLNKPLSGDIDVCGGIGVGGNEGFVETKITPPDKKSINSTFSEVNNDNVCASVGETVERNLPRQRPTTLNLNTQLQKQQQEQQRQRLNIQLQQRFLEQRSRQQQQQQLSLPPQNQNHTILAKPIRKAPLPPIAPKPLQFQSHNHTNTNAYNSFVNDSLLTNQTTTSSPVSESEISVSVSLSTPSPTLSSPNTTTTHHLSTITNQQHQPHFQTKSPIRHRSVITLQPEPPYTRDFLLTPNSSTPSSPSLPAPLNAGITTTQTSGTNSSSSATSSPTTSLAGSQKSFTSVNLTLRPPISPTGAKSVLQPSTIDITAGPGFSGASGGGKSLHYSSTSYDARLGYKQNFQITVTDEGGVFSACRLRPPQQRTLNQVNIRNDNELNGNCIDERVTNQNYYKNSILNYEKQQQQQQLQLQQQQFHNNNVVALQQNIQNSIQSPYGIGGVNSSSGFGSSGGTSRNISANMCLPPQQAMDGPTQEILQRQKKKRDKLAAALREYKKRLGNVEQEINLLTGTIPTEGLSERLDEEITQLRRDCQDMLRSSNTFTQPPSQQELAINYQPQPFPRPPPRPPPPRQTSLDIIQHHSQTSTPHTPPAASLPNLHLYNSPQPSQHQQHVQQNYTNSLSSQLYYQPQSTPVAGNFGHSDNNVDHEEIVDDEGDDCDDEYDDEVVEFWECEMCTFRNHPQLNICETCENVRIIPGRLTNLSGALSALNYTNTATGTAAVSPNLSLLRHNDSANGSNNASNTSSNSANLTNGNLEHDTNLVQQQLQHFALHT